MFTVLFLGLILIHSCGLYNNNDELGTVIHFIFFFLICTELIVANHRIRKQQRLSPVKSPSDIKTPSLNLGFSHTCAVPDSYLIGEKKKVHTQSHACAVCLSLQAKLLHLFVRLLAFFRHPKVAWCQGRA